MRKQVLLLIRFLFTDLRKLAEKLIKTDSAEKFMVSPKSIGAYSWLLLANWPRKLSWSQVEKPK